MPSLARLNRFLPLAASSRLAVFSAVAAILLSGSKAIQASVPLRTSVVCCLWLALISLGHGQNLVTNGNFESGYNIGWNHQANNGGAATYTEETTNPYEGSKALKVVVTTLGANTWNVQSLGPTVSLSTGSNYTLTFWGKAAANGTQVKIVIQNGIFLASNFTLSTTWTKYTWNLTAAEASPSVRLQYFQTGTIWMDDIQLTANIPHVGPYDITLTPAIQHQTMVGFGAALSWYTTWIYGGNNANDVQLQKLMFEDLGIDVLRLKNWYYPVGYPSSTNPNNVESQAAFDTNKLLFDAAKAANPDIQILLSSWSPPASLKSTGQRNGVDLGGSGAGPYDAGTLTQDGDGFMYDEFAQYWVDCLNNLGWTPDYLSFQNEPGWNAAHETCIMRPTETATNAGYAEAADAIWNAIKDRPNVPKMLGSESENIGNTTWSDWNGNSSVNTFQALNTPLLSKPYIAAHGYHTYNIYNATKIDSNDTINQLNMVRDSFGDRPNWMTEWSNDGLDWLQTARVIHNTIVEANCSSYIYWKLAWNDTPDTMIALLNTNGSYEVRPHYYVLKHYAKHISKGHRRIEIGGSTADLKVSGFLSPSGNSITLVVINKSASAEQINLINGGLSISSVAGYRSTAGNFYQTMSGLSASSPIDLPASSLTTLVLSLSSPYNLPPRLSSVDITDNLNGATATVNSPVTYTLAFDEDMNASTFTAADLGNAGTASISIGAITETSANSGVFTVIVTPTSTGTLKLKVNAGAVIKDTPGTNLDTTSAIIDLGSIPVQSVFAAWAGVSAAEGDANSDGVSNVMAWILGAATPNSNAVPLLPVFDNTSDAQYCIFTYRRRDSANADPATSIAVKYGSNLSSWTTAVDDGTNIIITPTNDHYGSGIDRVEVKLKRTLNVGGKIFCRLQITNSP